MQSKIEDMKLHSRKYCKLSNLQSKSLWPKQLNSFENYFDFDLVRKDKNNYYKSSTTISIKVHNRQILTDNIFTQYKKLKFFCTIRYFYKSTK